ncbi:MAG: hypothetical protein ACR2JF_05830 [Iamia sp.]
MTITVDDELAEEVSLAVEEGRGESVSAWINAAMADRLARDRRLGVLAALLDDYEAEHGEITEEEIAEQAQGDRDAAAGFRAPARRS